MDALCSEPEMKSGHQVFHQQNVQCPGAVTAWGRIHAIGIKAIYIYVMVLLMQEGKMRV